MSRYVRGHLEGQFISSFSRLIRDKQPTILAAQPERAIPPALQQLSRVERLLAGSRQGRHEGAAKIEEHLKDLYRTRTGREIEEGDLNDDHTADNPWDAILK